MRYSTTLYLLLFLFFHNSYTAKAASDHYYLSVGETKVIWLPSDFSEEGVWSNKDPGAIDIIAGWNNPITIKVIDYVDHRCLLEYKESYGKLRTYSVFIDIRKTTVSSITLNKSSLTLTEGETFQLEATIHPSDATDKSVEWKSSSSYIARVSDDGLVTALNEGIATITCEAKDGSGVKASCQVKVEPGGTPITNILLNETSLSLSVDETKQLVATILPSNATNKNVTWSSSKESIAIVSSTGLVTAKALGNATITCKADDGSGVMAMCSVTVKSNSSLNGIVVVETTGGGRMEYQLSSEPRITPNGSIIKLSTTDTTIELQADQVSKVYIDSSSDVDAVKSSPGEYIVTSDRVFFSGYGVGVPITVYNIDGMQIQRRVTNANGCLTLPLSELSTGIFIVKTPKQSIKILRK